MFCECSWRQKFLKYTIFISNFLGWLLGLGLLGLGAWVVVQRRKYDSVSSLAVSPAIIILVAGSVVFIIGFFGCLGAMRKKRWLLETYVVLLTILFLLEVVAGILAFVYRDEIRDEVSDVIKETVENYKNPDYDHELQDVLDEMQKQLTCCGATNYNDWESNPYFSCSSPTSTNINASACGVPRSCCKTDKDNPMCGVNTRRSTSTTNLAPSQTNVYLDGCVSALEEWFDEYVVAIGWTAFALAVLQALGIVFANCLLRDIQVEMRVSEAGEEIFGL